MSDCKNCVEIKTELERVNTAYDQEKQMVAELLAQVEQLKLSAIVAFDPDHKFVDFSEPFDDLHIDQHGWSSKTQSWRKYYCQVNLFIADFLLFKFS